VGIRQNSKKKKLGNAKRESTAKILLKSIGLADLGNLSSFNKQQIFPRHDVKEQFGGKITSARRSYEVGKCGKKGGANSLRGKALCSHKGEREGEKNPNAGRVTIKRSKKQNPIVHRRVGNRGG